MKIKKGDLVKIISGKDKGKTGKVINVDKNEEKVVVEGLNIAIRHSRPKKQGEKGQRLETPKPLHMSNVMLVCPKCNQPTRLNLKKMESGRVRVCKKCKETIA